MLSPLEAQGFLAQIDVNNYPNVYADLLNNLLGEMKEIRRPLKR
jgi:hypothetical protein